MQMIQKNEIYNMGKVNKNRLKMFIGIVLALAGFLTVISVYTANDYEQVLSPETVQVMLIVGGIVLITGLILFYTARNSNRSLCTKCGTSIMGCRIFGSRNQ